MKDKDQHLIFEAYDSLNEALSVDDAANALVSGVTTVPPEQLQQHVDNIKYDVNSRDWSNVLLKIRQIHDAEQERAGGVSSLQPLLNILGPLPTHATSSGRPSYGTIPASHLTGDQGEVLLDFLPGNDELPVEWFGFSDMLNDIHPDWNYRGRMEHGHYFQLTIKPGTVIDVFLRHTGHSHVAEVKWRADGMDEPIIQYTSDQKTHLKQHLVQLVTNLM